ncbi:MAG: UDP-N-acetylmuramate--L-alanine ligase [Clostridia bacterium]|nr:UDP-N-acetylmuramate--L-alanine ligase [Clostridia bacterium]
MINYEILKNSKNIHMIGIGGISMSGIAEILENWGYNVTGSDMADSDIIRKLIKNGINVKIGDNLDDLKKADIVVYTAAIKEDNIERVTAENLKIPAIERADFLGLLTTLFENTICISGTHGKTTTTSMVSLCFMQANLNPSIQVGAILKQLEGNYRIGGKDYFIIEACEYVDSFLKFFPKAEVILNIDNDHLDYFKSLDNIKKSFGKYVELLPYDGVLVYNIDDENCKEIPKHTNATVISYGIFNQDADFRAENISFDYNGFPKFDVYFKNAFYQTIQLSVVGYHNILNALSCVALCDYYEIPKRDISEGLRSFTGAHRRFEYVGEFNGATVYDDYGHHPTEIDATVKALRNKKYNKSWVVFQPHTYSRTKNHLSDFAKALLGFDNVIVTDIYAAREKNIYDISSKDLVNEINSLGKEAKFISNFDDIIEYLRENVKSGDIVLTLGAGTITELGYKIIE